MKYRPELIDFFARESFISILRNRFKTYGFNQINTPTFENYDLYSTVQGTISKDEMLKVISPNGKVLVLRPDVTIPVTQLVAIPYTGQTSESRYSYITDIFRSSFETNYGYVKMQAGVELFGSTSAESDMEVISLAIDCLTNLGFDGFKIQLGHAGVVNEILDILSLPPKKEEQFKQLIHSKNIAGLEEFMKTLTIEPAIKKRL
nr:ATP phosphoribosyltransferase regulatory subunit [Ornithinibacillus scapharcae]